MRAWGAITGAIAAAVLLAGCGGGDDAGGERGQGAQVSPSARPVEIVQEAVAHMRTYRDVTYRGKVVIETYDGDPVRAPGEWIVNRNGACELTARSPELGEVTYRRQGKDMYVTADDRGWVGWLGYSSADVSWLRGKWTRQALDPNSYVGCEYDEFFSRRGGWEDPGQPDGLSVRGTAARVLRTGEFMGMRRTVYLASDGDPRILRIRSTDYGKALRGPARVDLVGTDTGARLTRPAPSDVLETQ